MDRMYDTLRTVAKSAVPDRALALVNRGVVQFNRLATESPFGEDGPALLVHCCHHRSGTVWFTRVLSTIARQYGLRFQEAEQAALEASTEVFLQDHSRIDRSALPPYRGSHMIRDPRDMVVSGYHYHLWTEEGWAHKPREKYDGKSFREALNSVGKKRGMILEMERFCEEDLQDMLRWRYGDPAFLELKYEDVIADEASHFQNLFEHYGFHDEALKVGLDVARYYSFQNLSGRNFGEVEEESHLRSGRTSQWEDHFDDELKDRFKELAGNAVVQLGYEEDNDW
ncbi:sulfotransferase domain-containing protein [Salinibacter grassmerensis]|uniref:sulfotransferase domain-containing protein n=1 Tax=Salinibacter grassmerensis TaxID=3040353 RepID=UPI0021E87601|nr:sulfotransferase domain-containing protein [Salinibacter grassmerensis]